MSQDYHIILYDQGGATPHNNSCLGITRFFRAARLLLIGFEDSTHNSFRRFYSSPSRALLIARCSSGNFASVILIFYSYIFSCVLDTTSPLDSKRSLHLYKHFPSITILFHSILFYPQRRIFLLINKYPPRSRFLLLLPTLPNFFY